MGKDIYGNTHDDQGTHYLSNSGNEATHGESVRVNDGTGNLVPGYMNYGTAVPTKND